MGPADATAPSHQEQDPREDSLEDRVRAWCSAWDRHDTGALASLYDDQVRSGKRLLTKAELTKQWETFFQAEPSYRRRIDGPITVTNGANGLVVAQFQDRRETAKRTTSSQTTLTFRRRDAAPPVVTSEEFVTVQAPVGHEQSNLTDCANVATRVVLALPGAQRAIDEAQSEAARSDGGEAFDDPGPIFDTDDAFQRSIGVSRGGRSDTRLFYGVKARRLFVEVRGAPQSIPEEAASAVAKACP
jgi:hypothetical protein